MAVWTAVELNNAFSGDVGISMTPVGGGRLEVYVAGDLVYNNKERGLVGIGLNEINELKMVIRERLETVTSAS